jgi:transcriptional regulator
MGAEVQPLRAEKHRRIGGPHGSGHLAFPLISPYHIVMLPSERTPRQRIIDLLTDTLLSTDQLARRLGIPERQVEEHLSHVVKTVARDRSRRFILEPSLCMNCGYMFRDRTKLTRPSRCPRCRSEGISPPRYKIDSLGSESTYENTKVSRRSDAWKGSL